MAIRAVGKNKKITIVLATLPAALSHSSPTFHGFSFLPTELIKRGGEEEPFILQICVLAYIFEKKGLSGFLTYFSFPFDP